MEFLTNEYTFPSHSGLCDINAQSAAPMDYGSIKGIVQVSHGLAEYSGRYARFAYELCKHGYAVFVSDHLGHGSSVTDSEMLGFMAEENGEEYLVEDLKSLTDIIKNEYSNLPIYMFGHGMGSLIARKYTAKYGYLLDGVIYSSTTGENPAIGVGIHMANTLIKQNGSKYRSEVLDAMAFGSYNRKTEKRTEWDWISRDKDEVDKYIEDDLCGFIYTVSGLRTVFNTLKQVSTRRWYNSVPLSMPILLLAGTNDPAGDYSKGVNDVYKTLKKTGHKKVTIKLYDGARHELLNEINRDEVTADIIEWLDSLSDTHKEQFSSPEIIEEIVNDEKANNEDD
ncbi:MAG: alpha/beta hydrolase [Clostridiales bacterium]|nr:alpha/beta hydrolase [Clostridiales bacterium]